MDIKDKIINRKHKIIKYFFYKELTINEQQYLITKFNSNNISEICYRELNNIINIPKCKYCGELLTFKNFNIGYGVTCKNTKCQYQKRKETMIQHYGVENVFQLDYVKDKCKKTLLEKYEVDNISQYEYIKKKKEETCLKHNGVKYGLQLKKCIINATKYKQKHKKEWLEKIKQTCLKKYGVNNVSQCEYVKKKKEETCLNNWGVTNYWKDSNNRKNFNTEESRKKEYITKQKNNSFNTSKTEDQSYFLLKEKYPDVLRQYRSELYPFNCDFYIPSLDLYIECQYGQFHHQRPYIGNEQDLKDVEILKEKANRIHKQNNVKLSRYDVELETWTIRDVNKRNIVKQNNLNYIEFWNINELKEWIN